MVNYRSLAGLIVAICLAGTVLLGVPSYGDTSTCKKIEAIYAMGSGETINSTAGYKEMLADLEDSFTDNFHLYQLGTQSYGGVRYEPVGVNNKQVMNGLGAWYGSSMDFAYGRSVERGETEFQSYIAQRAHDCPNSHFFVAGYSQGAQVVGNSLFWIPLAVRQKISFVALYGDPRLNLPEGRGWNPPACRYGTKSTWRRDVPNCDVDNGSLGARDAYLPTDMEKKTGLWCNNHDFVCGSSKNPFDVDGHGKYADQNAVMDSSVYEAYDRMRQYLPDGGSSASLDLSHLLSQHDYVVVVDAGDLDSSGLNILRQRARLLARGYSYFGANVGLVEVLHNPGVSQDYRALSNLTEGMDGFERGLSAINVIDHCQAVTESQQMVALGDMMSTINWTHGSIPEITYVTGGEVVRDCYDRWNDEFDYGATLGSVTTQSLQKGGLHVNAVAPVFSQYNQRLDDIVRSTGGYFYNTGEVTLTRKHNNKIVLASIDPNSSGDAIIDQVLKNSLNQPAIRFETDRLTPEVDDVVTFDISRSAARYDNIDRYEWDFDGDGLADEVTTTPIVTHTYTSLFSGFARVKAITTEAYGAQAAIRVYVGDHQQPAAPSPPSNLMVEVLTTQSHASSVMLRWKAPAKLPYKYLLKINDKPVGTLDSDRVSIGVTGVDRSQDVNFSLVSLDENWNTSTSAEVMLAKEDGRDIANLSDLWGIGKQLAGVGQAQDSQAQNDMSQPIDNQSSLRRSDNSGSATDNGRAGGYVIWYLLAAGLSIIAITYLVMMYWIRHHRLTTD